MSDTVLLVLLLFCSCEMAAATKNTESAYCFKIEPGTMAGIIVGDVALTLLIVVVVFRCASRRRRKKEEAEKVYMNVRANCKA